MQILVEVEVDGTKMEVSAPNFAFWTGKRRVIHGYQYSETLGDNHGGGHDVQDKVNNFDGQCSGMPNKHDVVRVNLKTR